MEELASAQENLQQSTDSSAKSHQDNVKSLKAEADASKKLAAQITELSRKENKSAADKALLKSYVEQLNAEYDGLIFKKIEIHTIYLTNISYLCT